jgi:cobalt-zinc-cadmium efflux system membrane fusion protein
VTAAQSGVITHVNVPLGVKVTKGQVLAEIDSVALVDLQRSLVDASAVFGVAAAKLNRDEILLREGVISRMRLQETQSDFERAQATLRAAEQTLLASGIAQADIDRIKTNTTHINGLYKVLAPVDGMVLDRMAMVGQRVDAFSPLFRIGKLDVLWLEVDMPQERLKEARIGDRVTVENLKVRARVIEISQSVDPQSQSTVVRALVESGTERLRPGMHVNVQTMHRSTDRIFKVPVAAVFSHEGHNYVFVKRLGGFEAVEVAVAGQEAYSMVLHEGLQGGEAVVVQGVAGLKAAWLGSTGSHSD